MSLGLSEDRNRRRKRRQFAGALFRWAVVLAVGAGVGVYAHDVGTDIAQQQVSELKLHLTEEIEAGEKLRAEIAGLQAALRKEREKVADWSSRYEAEVPSEREKLILRAVRERLDNGISGDRILAMIAITRDDVACEPLGPSKRFIINNEIDQGANGWVSFADGAVTVTGTGTAARNEANQPVAWFDPGQPVTVNFTHRGGEVSQVTGLLPVHHAVAVGKNEYRFSIVAGPRAFVLISGESCRIS